MDFYTRVTEAINGRIERYLLPPKNKWPQKRLVKGLQRGYKIDHGHEMNFDAPTLFTEKLQWYKVFYRHPDMARAVDKYLFKSYIEEKLGPGNTIPCYGAWTDINELEKAWDSLPETFILKSTLQSDGKCIKTIKEKSKTDFQSIKAELASWLEVRNTLINSYCCAYYGATPRILAEEYVETIAHELFDYKFLCFGGKPTYIYCVTEHFRGGAREAVSTITFYDLDWNVQDVHYGPHPTGDNPRPPHLAEMTRLAEKLSKDFPFVRVDFFDTPDKLYVAELTFYPGGGNMEYRPRSFDRKLGDLFVLPPKNV